LSGRRGGPRRTWRTCARYLQTSSGAKWLQTRHALVADWALSVRDRTPYEHGITGGMSFLLGEIERLACEGEPEDVDVKM
jgi:hypothetical protein